MLVMDFQKLDADRTYLNMWKQWINDIRVSEKKVARIKLSMWFLGGIPQNTRKILVWILGEYTLMSDSCQTQGNPQSYQNLWE